MTSCYGYTMLVEDGYTACVHTADDDLVVETSGATRLGAARRALRLARERDWQPEDYRGSSGYCHGGPAPCHSVGRRPLTIR